MIEATTESLLKLAAKLQLAATLQEETDQLIILLKEDEREFPLFIRPIPESEFLQLIAFFPFQLPIKTIAEVARLLHILNKELDIPGFGMDEMSFVTFFRIMVPAPGGKVEEKLIEGYLATIKTVCKTFSPTIEAIASGSTTIDTILKKAETAAKEMKA